MEIIWLSALIALFSLDQKHAFQLALSQPLILCSILGFITGEFETAIYFGLFVQLIWLGNLPVGASTTPEGNLASAVGCLLYIQFNENYAQFGQLLLLLAFLYTIIISFIGGQVDVKTRTFNIRLFDFTVDNIQDDKKANIGKIILLSLFIQYLVSFIFIALSNFLGIFLLNQLLPFFSIDLVPFWQYIDLAIIGIGIGMVMSVYKGRRLKKIILAISIFSLIIFKII
ncbi:MAG: hypothetical protein HND50_13500 [Calditrichaeota bacterium]|nr:hypothetical protein [Calditrichota bacterium]